MIGNNLIMTRHMYPLDKNNKSEFFGGIYFDNPRTKEEIDEVAATLKKINYIHRPFPEEDKKVGEGYITLRWIFESFCENNIGEKNVKSFYEKYRNEKNIYRVLAKMWVIVRCDEILSKDKLDSIFMIKVNAFSDNLVPQTNVEVPNNLINGELIFQYINFLMFININEGYRGQLLLIDNLYGLLERHIGINLFSELIVIASNDRKSSAVTLPLTTFNNIQSIIMITVDKVKERYKEPKFKYICQIINNLCNVRDERMRLLSLISIIEMLITHNPAGNRFNVEDSISKQFVNKLMLILYDDDNSIDKNKIKKELKLAYELRSDIVHGNFDNIEKTLKKIFDFYELKKGIGFEYNSLETSIDYLNSSIEKYVKVIIRLYLYDETRLELIKAL